MELILSKSSAKLKCVNKLVTEFKVNKLKYTSWLKCKSNNKKGLEVDYCAEHKIFDRLKRRFKRQYQQKQQEKKSSGN